MIEKKIPFWALLMVFLLSLSCPTVSAQYQQLYGYQNYQPQQPSTFSIFQGHPIIQDTTMGAGLGAVVGAIAAPNGSRGSGALKGGLIGGIAGGGYGFLTNHGQQPNGGNYNGYPGAYNNPYMGQPGGYPAPQNYAMPYNNSYGGYSQQSYYGQQQPPQNYPPPSSSGSFYTP
jgi:hypothetical protein